MIQYSPETGVLGKRENTQRHALDKHRGARGELVDE
jgi:hypothetical protein